MRVIFKPTGQGGTIPDNEFDPNIYDRADQTNPFLASVARSSPTPPQRSELPNMSFGGLLSNASQNVGEIAQGVTKLPQALMNLSPLGGLISQAQGKNASMEQGKQLLNMGKGIAGEYNELLGRPFEGGDFMGRIVKHAYEKPVSTALDVYGGVKAAQSVKNLMSPKKAVSEIPASAQVTPTEMAKIDVAANAPKTTLATKTFLSPFTIPTKIGYYMKPHEVAKYFVDRGVSGSLDDLKGISNTVTGSGGKITQLTDELASSIETPVTLSADLLDKSQKAELIRIYGAEAVPQLASKGSVALPAADALTFQRQLETLGHQYMKAGTNYLTPNVRYEQLGTSYLDAAKEIGDSLNKLSVEPQLLSVIKTPQNIEYLNGIVSGLGDDLLKVKTFGELRSLAAPYVKLGQMVDLTLGAGQSAFNKLTTGLSDAIPSLAHPFAPLEAGVKYIAGSPAARTGAAQTINKLADVQTGAKSFTDQVLSLAPKVGFAANLNRPEELPPELQGVDLPATQAMATSNPLISKVAASGSETPSEAIVKSINTQAQPTTPTGQFSSDQLYQGYYAAQQQGDNVAADQLLEMAKVAAEQKKTAAIKPNQINTKAINGLQALSEVERMFGITGDDTAPLDKSQMTTLSRLGPGRNAYDTAADRVIDNLLRAQGSAGGSRYLIPLINSYRDKFFPRVADINPLDPQGSDATIRFKLNSIREQLKNLVYTKPTTDMTDLITQSQE